MYCGILVCGSKTLLAGKLRVRSQHPWKHRYRLECSLIIWGLASLFQVHSSNRVLIVSFESFIEFYEVFVYCPPSLQCFHEVILDDQGQKPRFDIDASPDQVSGTEIWLLVMTLIRSLVDVMASWNISVNLERHVLVYSSSSIDKYSYHVVIDGFYHRDSYAARDLYSRVVSRLLTVYKLPERLVSCLDPAVYSQVQNFRVPGAVKEVHVLIPSSTAGTSKDRRSPTCTGSLPVTNATTDSSCFQRDFLLVCLVALICQQ